jgi:pyridoxamine 5'-phosphate oxidase
MNAMLKKRLLYDDLHSDPIIQFRRWYRTASYQYTGFNPEVPAAMALATSTKNGSVGVRYVLFKGIDHNGFVFYTDYTSPKGRALAENPHAAAAFYWPECNRQVRITGTVQKLSTAQSDRYFARRPRLSRIAAIANRQSRPISFTTDLKMIYGEIDRRTKTQSLPRPVTWGGYRLLPNTIEFWQAAEFRMHDRFLYRRSGKKWTIQRLSP